MVVAHSTVTWYHGWSSKLSMVNTWYHGWSSKLSMFNTWYHGWSSKLSMVSCIYLYCDESSLDKVLFNLGVTHLRMYPKKIYILVVQFFKHTEFPFKRLYNIFMNYA